MTTLLKLIVELGDVTLDAQPLPIGKPAEILLGDEALTLKSASEQWRVAVINSGDVGSSNVEANVFYEGIGDAGVPSERYVLIPRGQSQFGSSIVLEGESGDLATLRLPKMPSS